MTLVDGPTPSNPVPLPSGPTARVDLPAILPTSTKRLWLAVVLVYLIAFALPVFSDTGPLANHLGVRPHGFVYGWQAFVIGLVVRPVGWVANLAIWLGILFLAWRKPRLAAAAGILAIVLGLMYLELLVGHSLLSPKSYSAGYFCWLASALLLAAAGLGLRWFGPGRRLRIFAVATVVAGVALLATVEHSIVAMTAPPSEATLADRLRSDDVNARRTAARKLALDHNPELISVFIEATKDPDDKVRQSAIGALGDMGPRAAAAVPTLIAILNGPAPTFEKKADPKRAANSRSAAAAALGNIGPAAKEAVPALVTGLKDENLPVRRWSATSLGEMGAAGRSAVPALVRALRDPDAQVRRYAIQSLQKIGMDHDSLPALKPSLQDSDAAVRETAAALLGSPNKTR